MVVSRLEVKYNVTHVAFEGGLIYPICEIYMRWGEWKELVG